MTAEQFLVEKHGDRAQLFPRSAVELLMEQYHAFRIQAQAASAYPKADAFVPTLTYQEGYEEVRSPQATGLQNQKTLLDILDLPDNLECLLSKIIDNNRP